MYELSKDFPWERPRKERLPILGVIAGGEGSKYSYTNEIQFYSRRGKQTRHYNGTDFFAGISGMQFARNSVGTAYRQFLIGRKLGLPWHLIAALVRGNCDIHTVINTDGGLLYDYELLKLCFAYARERDNTVSTYICDRAFSLGAYSWALGDHRSAHEGALAMWHTPSSRFEPVKDVRPRYREETLETFSSAPKSWREAVREQASRSPDFEFYTVAEDLAEMGLCHDVFPTRQALLNHVAVQTGFRIDFEDRDPVSNWVPRSAADGLKLRASQLAR